MQTLYRILIADDETLIVNGLSEKIDWASMECIVVGTATNGLEALQYIETLAPDILLTDIVMPGMSGLDLARRIQERKLPTQVILLSTYDHFEYAREGLRIGVCDYILKPIDKDRLMEAVSKAKGLLKSQGPVKQPSVDDTELLFELALYGPAVLHDRVLPYRMSMIACVQTYNRAEENPFRILERIRDFIQHADDDLEFMFLSRTLPPQELMVFLLRNEHAAHVIRDIVTRAVLQIPSVEAICSVAICDAPVPPAQLHEQYLICRECIEQGYFSTSTGTLKYRPSTVQDVQAELGELMQVIAEGRTRDLSEPFERFCGKLYLSGDASQAKYMLRELYRLATNCASRMGMADKPVIQKGCYDENFAASTRAAYQYLSDIAAWASEGKLMRSNLVRLVNDNYMRTDFNLTDAAEKLGISIAYLSRMFKRETGEGFQEMLTRIRIEHAADMLANTDRRIRDIAADVGFENERYFGQVFRKYMSMTPSVYRVRNGKNSNI